MRVHTLQSTLRDMSARASNPKLTQRERETAQRNLRMLRARFDDATLCEAIDYPCERLPGWALPPTDSEGEPDTSRFALTQCWDSF